MTTARRTKLAGVPFTEDHLDEPVPAGALRHAPGGDPGPAVALPEPPPGGWVTPAEVARATANVAALSRWAIRQLADSSEPEAQVQALLALRAASMAAYDVPNVAARCLEPPVRQAPVPVPVWHRIDPDLAAAAAAVLAHQEDQ